LGLELCFAQLQKDMFAPFVFDAPFALGELFESIVDETGGMMGKQMMH